MRDLAVLVVLAENSHTLGMHALSLRGQAQALASCAGHEQEGPARLRGGEAARRGEDSLGNVASGRLEGQRDGGESCAVD